MSKNLDDPPAPQPPVLPSRFQLGDKVKYLDQIDEVVGVTFRPFTVYYDLLEWGATVISDDVEAV